MNRAYVIAICKFFFPDNPPANVTHELEELAALMLHEALKASNALDFVPRPTGSVPGPSWLRNQAVMIFWRTQSRERIYETARRAVALKWRGKYELVLAEV